MNTFNWLLIGHLVGDWLLQNDWMAWHKKQSFFTRGGIIHFTIYTISIIGALWCAGLRGQPPIFYVSLGLYIFISHWLIDATTVVERWTFFFHQNDKMFVRIMVDQTLHLLLLVLLTLFSSGV